MKFIFSIILLSNLMLLNALTVPFSKKVLKTNKNHVADLVRISPDDSLKINLPTDMWLWQDKKNLFILWEAKIDSTFCKGNFVPNDYFPEADFLRAQLITNEKNYYAYMFYAFPLNSKLDGIRNKNMNIDNNWNSNYEYTNKISQDKWSCLMKIPFKDLRFYGKNPYYWKIIFTRYGHKNNEYYSNPYTQTSMGKDYFRKALNISIPDKIESNKNYMIKPYVIYKYNLRENMSSFDKDNLGLDFSFNPNFSTKMKLSFNPDFSDVPIDEEADNFNVKYAPRFDENRYFFVEDLDVFGVDDFLFYTRNIMQPKYAVKITSDNSKYSWGILSSQDKEMTQNGNVTNRDDFYNAFAFKKKGDIFNIQMTLLNRMKNKYHNEVLHIVPSWEIFKNNYVWLKSDFSFYKKEDKKTGYVSSLGYSGSKDNLNWNTNLTHCSEDFRADMGNVNETGYYSMNVNLNYNKNDDGKNVNLIKEYGISSWSNFMMYDSNDTKPTRSGGFNLWCNSTQDINLWTNVNFGKENYSDKLFGWYSANFGIKYDKFQILEPSINFTKGKNLVYYFEKTYNKNSVSFSLNGIIQPFISYETSLMLIKYPDLPKNSVFDDNYCIGNANINLNISNNWGISNGIRFNNYESGDYSKHLGYFSNLHWAYKNKFNLYAGYSSAKNDIEKKSVEDYANLYMKLAYNF